MSIGNLMWAALARAGAFSLVINALFHYHTFSGVIYVLLAGFIWTVANDLERMNSGKEE